MGLRSAAAASGWAASAQRLRSSPRRGTPILVIMRALTRIAGLTLLAIGCASATAPLVGELRCPEGTTERVATRAPNLEDHLCEDAEGLAQGVAWTSDGTRVRVLRSYRNGESNGTTRVWSEDGRLLAEIQYRRGEPIRFRMWHDNGRLAEEERHENAENARIWECDEEGNLTDEAYYRNGKIDGVWTEYWPDGSLRRRAEWRAGKLDGEFTEWYESGNLRARGKFANNRKIGKWRFWDHAGTESDRIY